MTNLIILSLKLFIGASGAPRMEVLYVAPSAGVIFAETKCPGGAWNTNGNETICSVGTNRWNIPQPCHAAGWVRLRLAP